MARAINNQEDREHWSLAEQGRLTDQDWTRFLQSRELSASVDYPMSLYWKVRLLHSHWSRSPQILGSHWLQ